MAAIPSLGALEMTIAAGDGLILKGVLEYPDASETRPFPLAVLAHQYPATGDSFAPLVEDLLELGFATLAFDLRGHGSSTQGPSGAVVIDAPASFADDAFAVAFMGSVTKVGFDRIDDDVLRVAAWGATQNHIDAARILLVGASVGGSGVLLAAPQVPGLAALVTFGAAGAPAFGIDGPARIRRAVGELDVPCLLATSEQDPFNGAANARDWSHGLAHATAHIVPGSAHGMAIYFDVREDVLAFVRRSLEK